MAHYIFEVINGYQIIASRKIKKSLISSLIIKDNLAFLPIFSICLLKLTCFVITIKEKPPKWQLDPQLLHPFVQ
jgi:hypothetical protein